MKGMEGSCDSDQEGEAPNVKWKRQFPLPLAPTRE